MRDGLLVYDTDFRILSVNRAAEEIFNLKAGEVLNKNIEPGLVSNPRLRALAQVIFPSLAPTMSPISESGWPQITEITLEDPHLEIKTSLNRIVNDKGEVVGFLRMVTDLTREKNIVQSKTEFVSVAAHQLRTPLTALNWSLENLNKMFGEKDLNIKAAADLAKESWGLAERSLKIVNDLLNAARIEEGRFGFNFEEVDLSEFIGKIVKQAEPIAKQYSIKIKTVSDGKKYVVRIDRELLGIAISNLLDNGIKYNTKNGEVVVTIGADPNPDFVRVKVEDTGVGIPKEDLAKIFERFYRGTNIAQIDPNGSGLGLYVAKNIVGRLGGKIGVESQVGRGTTLLFTLPLNFKLIPVQPAI